MKRLNFFKLLCFTFAMMIVACNTPSDQPLIPEVNISETQWEGVYREGFAGEEHSVVLAFTSDSTGSYMYDLPWNSSSSGVFSYNATDKVFSFTTSLTILSGSWWVDTLTPSALILKKAPHTESTQKTLTLKRVYEL